MTRKKPCALARADGSPFSRATAEY